MNKKTLLDRHSRKFKERFMRKGRTYKLIDEQLKNIAKLEKNNPLQ